MKRLNHWLRNYFGFSKTESNGFIVLIPLMFIIVVTPYALRYLDKVPQTSFDEAAVDNLISELRLKEEKQHNPRKAEQREVWISKQNYREKKKKPELIKPERKFVRKTPIIDRFDINQADTVILKQIRGIGPVLSTRIVKYRDMLGGFVDKNQLAEVYGLKEEVLQRLDSLSFIADDYKPKQLALNDLEAYLLDDHPYVSKKVASAIDAYRFQHGKIDRVETLYEIHLLDTATVKKIYPYILF
ncbi:hypothetical protein E1176_18295 [Fulvivirga sp. RKSG066]|uniref:helix-hairpin-helix domain-containing protein n=1 Tax=Fulvivirga aurantia TaxID=2529383 RepID=UPI0012BBE14F|nr:helix-hairpin-helix domain-containing protein [Fulvivirga aurantia]MTI22987.1 hypothetical protein [Fulvivirga aurantia]